MNRPQLLIGLVVVALAAIGIAGYFVLAPDDDVQASGAPKFPVTLSSYDRPQGNPKAPITMVEYAAPTCPICAHFDMTMFPELKKDYIDTGKVYYVYRVLPLRAPDIAADAIARCLPADNYFSFIDLLYRNQPKWDPDGYDIPDVRAALIAMAATAGMSADKANACIDDQAMQKKIVAVGQHAEKAYGVQGTPTFIVNGETAPYFETSADVKKYLNSLLAKK